MKPHKKRRQKLTLMSTTLESRRFHLKLSLVMSDSFRM